MVASGKYGPFLYIQNSQIMTSIYIYKHIKSKKTFTYLSTMLEKLFPTIITLLSPATFQLAQSKLLYNGPPQCGIK